MEMCDGFFTRQYTKTYHKCEHYQTVTVNLGLGPTLKQNVLNRENA